MTDTEANHPLPETTYDVYPNRTNDPAAYATTEANPMLQQVKDTFSKFASAIVEASELTAKVSRLQSQVDALQQTQKELMDERMELRIKVREAQKQAVAFEDDNAKLKASLQEEQNQLVRLDREHYELQQAHQTLLNDHDHLRDDHDLGQMAHDDLLAKHEKLSTDYEGLTNDLATARSTWFMQEDNLQTVIRSLTSERNMYRDKFDACKSHAAKIMALDQVKVEPPTAGEAFH